VTLALSADLTTIALLQALAGLNMNEPLEHRSILDMTTNDWLPIADAPEGVEVMTKIDDGQGERNVQSLVKKTRIPGETRPMWWTPDGSMYVYYEPTHWRALSIPS
jgi:hypothetical protein